jgi:hypothetical protein
MCLGIAPNCWCPGTPSTVATTGVRPPMNTLGGGRVAPPTGLAALSVAHTHLRAFFDGAPGTAARIMARSESCERSAGNQASLARGQA